MKYRSSTRNRDGKSEVVFECDTPEEADLIEAALTHGTQWVHFLKGGEVKLSDALEPPVEVDPLTADHWLPGPVTELYDSGLRDQSRSYYVSGLGAYDGGSERRARALTEAGFACLRSRRGIDGRIWEHWYLSGKWSAKGPIKDKDDAEILQWLCRLGPGNITESGRTWGLGIDM